MFGNLENDYLFSTNSYLVDREDGDGKKFTKSVVDEEQLKLFEDFCTKEGIKRQDSANSTSENEYHIFEGFKILCGSKIIYEKLAKHLQENIPLKSGKIIYR